MSAPVGTDRGEFARPSVLDEKWLVRELSHKGALVVCIPADRQTPGTPNAELRMQRIPSHLQNLVTERVRVLAAAPAAVRLALKLRTFPTMIRSADDEFVHVSVEREEWTRMQDLLAEVTAALEGRS